ncbi:hypothetical protein P167DRAFT_555421 [Morchella conica CCBAS932]|uniref:Uncharacterized protein n=1 Tax=Morchella conica CCBAS932 TaxID=1392247 RepID=A0A3N4KCR1_9PEZI|nr:hypothetical protein P167DRAFT_555421 [Morchella conica CCBAS932]
MLTDIDLYKRDIVGFKKDISRRDAQILELQQHTATPSLELDNLRAANARIAEELRVHKTAANAVIATRDAEIARLEEVVGGLKMCISTSTRVEEAVGDEVFRDAWGRIGYDVVNWCLTNGAVKGGRVDVGSLDAEVRAVLERAVPGHDGLVGDGRRVHVVQAVMADVLVREVFKGWFLGLEEDRDVALKGLEEMFADTASPVSLNSWRASTLTLLRTHLLATPAVLTELTTRITNALLTYTTPLLPTLPNASREKSLTAIVDATIRIATLMRCQRARFQIQGIPVGAKWDVETMEDLTGEEEDGSVVGCVAWPGVEKFGDEMGEGKEVRCVVRARVVCVEPGEGA